VTQAVAQWWVHLTTLRRASSGTGDGYGVTLAGPETPSGFVADKAERVRNISGDEVISSTQVAYPSSVGYIPPGSQVTLPPQFGSRTSTVIRCAVGDGGGQPTPDHVVVWLE